MPSKPFFQHWTKGTFPGIADWLAKRPHQSLFSGMCGSCDAWLIADLFTSSQAPVLVVVENSKKAEILAEECRTYLERDIISIFPTRDAVPYTLKSPFGPTTESRLKVLWQLLNREKRIYITPISSLTQRLKREQELFNSIIKVHTGDELTMEDLGRWLSESGFTRENLVTNLGTYSIRGNIFDIFPFMTENPVRLEFWGNTVESIRMFDAYSQKSHTPRSSIELFPMKEFYFSGAAISKALGAMDEFAANHGNGRQAVQTLKHQWGTLGDVEGLEWFLGWFGVPEISFLDYLPDTTIVVWDDVGGIEYRIDECVKNYERHFERLPEHFKPIASTPMQLLITRNAIIGGLEQFPMVFCDTRGAAGLTTYSCDFEPQPTLVPGIASLVDELDRRHESGLAAALLCENSDHAVKLEELVGTECPFVNFYTGFLSHGFIDRHNNNLLYTDYQIFNKQYRPAQQKKSKQGAPILSLDSLNPGDFVVHIDHGIAKFAGIERLTVGDMQRDCMVLLYEDRAKLLVPVEDFHKIQKYIGKDSGTPALSKLGSGAWDRLKQRTRESLRDMAQELIDLYARRQYMEGIAFSADTMWQKEFEDAFVFEETPDQLTSIRDVKKDMESKKPMDRLVCGDVGFGKTEVAMRAAFKAVMDGYQVAVLAPTTILASQHFTTFSYRMGNFPVRIGVASRFLSAKEQREVIAKVKKGEIDILIGTHRLLSKDVAFHNLGLLIVDEEQRFGVGHKEKLKQFKYKVDVLSMSATPIPRTLHMSLVGVRDLSIINTPPRNRLPIETRVAEYHDEIVKRAIETELERGGQVFVVHNRIGKLDLLRDRIEQMVPSAKVAIAHGQMDEKELVHIMKEFIAGHIDVLISTVIIENGLDISNVNTLVVIRADALGLSQLYQLRGRVGRSSEQAYAWFLTNPYKELGDIALKRLQALEQYTDLGSGFQIAMRDLEIRGAGNLLGMQQHGNIAAVGFEMYCRLLEEAIKEQRGEEVAKPEAETVLDIPLKAFIPNEYIADGAARIGVYHELSSVSSSDELEVMEKGIADRFGPIPMSVLSLFLLMRIKLLAKKAGCSKVSLLPSSEMLSLYFDGTEEEVKKQLEKIMPKTPRSSTIRYEQPLCLSMPVKGEGVLEQALFVKTFLEQFK